MPSIAPRKQESGSEKCTLLLRFQAKLGLKLALLAELQTILAYCEQEPEFITGFLNENPDKPGEVVLFEVWRGTREEFERVQGPKRYRQDYLNRSRPLVESVEVLWLKPTQEWGSRLLA